VGSYRVKCRLLRASSKDKAPIPELKDATPLATQPVDKDEPFLRLYALYRSYILQAAHASNADEVARLTEKFNKLIGGRLLYANVTRTHPSKKYVVLLSKTFAKPPIVVPKIHYLSTGRVHVARYDGLVLIQMTRQPDGRHKDDLKLLLAVHPTAANVPAVSTNMEPAPQPGALRTAGP
jgi:hypothetical protein